MLKDPFGHEWKQEQFNQELRARLGESYLSIESGMEELKGMVEDLKGKLGLGPDLKVNLSQSLFNALDQATAACCKMPHEAFLRLSPRPLVLKPGSFEDQVAKDLNFQLSLSLFMDDSTSSGAPIGHLRTYNLEIRIIEFGGGKAANYLPKTLDLRPSPNNTGSSSQHNGSSVTAKSGSKSQKQWKSQLVLRHIDRGMTRHGNAMKRLVQGSLSLIVEPNPKAVSCFQKSPPNPMSGLCQLIRLKEKSPISKNEQLFYGHLMDSQEPQRRFGLYAPKSRMSKAQYNPQPNDFPSDFSLRQLLNQAHDALSQQERDEPFISLGFQDQLQLAFTVAVNILHLYGSPWLPKTITLDDILFRLGDGAASSSDFPSGFPYRPFIKKCIPLSTPCAVPKADGFIPKPRERETTVFTFGLLLIQIMLGRVISDLDMNPALYGQRAGPPAVGHSTKATAGNDIVAKLTLNDYMEKYKLGKGFEDNILAEAGPEYTAAVTRCLESFINLDGLRSENFCHEFYADVIFKLQMARDKAIAL
ncbi:hypothetical protein B0T20DRAFT_359366 [Sordaria brevicollis]|uniref:DUF7580 domain-containing protein n=1 Tax=Sordaria brevicollis TaxID=83679 RepID=A0AAE0P9R8_SORBR|nr:hypothetical protein B0T20DRAFT_359366 [Sordaria brevicollis]